MTHSSHTLTLALTAFVTLSLVGCLTGTDSQDTNSDDSTRGLTFDLTNSSTGDTAGDEARLSFADDSGLTYTLTEARFVLRHIELDLPDDTSCADIRDQLAGGATCGSDDRDDDSDDDRRDDSSEDDKVRIEGPFVVDLMAGTTTPSLENVRLPDIAWRRIDLRVDDADDDTGLDRDDPLNDLSWLMKANFEKDGQPMTLEMALKFNEDIRFEARQGVSTSPDSPLFIGFDVAAWLDGLPIGECLEEGDLTIEDGVVVASDDSGEGECSDIEDVLKDNLKDSGDLR